MKWILFEDQKPDSKKNREKYLISTGNEVDLAYWDIECKCFLWGDYDRKVTPEHWTKLPKGPRHRKIVNDY